jgi:ATP-dependent exoDNAse (exonuclease V) beta subunit
MKNQRLRANAGSGKTHALTTRMIQLLARGVEPRKIAALTFTRKSAGEFLSAVFGRLAHAALDPDKLAELQTQEGLGNLDSPQCRTMLATLASQLGGLGMGTIDSLFARIARAFPLESGLAEDFTMAGEAEIDAARERTLAKLFAQESSASLADFIDLLRRINRNQGERDVFERLLKETQNLHGKFLATPQNLTWGDANAIWAPGECAIGTAGAVAPAADAFLNAVVTTHPDFSSEARRILETNLKLLKTLDTGGRWNLEISSFVKDRLCAEPKSGNLQITRQKVGRLTLNPQVRRARLDLLHAALKPEFQSLLLRSRSLHAFMKKFEETYSALVRSTGLITFGDITDSLAQKVEDDTWRATAAYRIDQKFEHWLLDEFQDTSRPQWKVLKTFIDEVLMDPEGQRSFFYVGDPKQAIYSWRGGTPDLFNEIFEEFNTHQPTIEDAPPLAQSWRSCPQILDFVNKTFGDLTSVQDTLEIPAATSAKWAEAWKQHLPSPKTLAIQGFAEWVSVPKNEGAEEEEGDAPNNKALEILNRTKAWERGLSCAVLERDNKGVASLAALLQSKGIPVAVEGKTNPCVDNPLGAALIAALQVVASPEDKLSCAVAQGFPAADAWGLGDVRNFRVKTLAHLARQGYAATIRPWIEASSLDAEPFLKERAASFLLAAEEFDACRKPADGIADFLRFVKNRQTQETEATGVVRVMTVHQSKGLGFDMVIVSGLDNKGRTNDGTTLALGPEAKDVKWGILMPSKEFAEQDAALQNQIAIQDAEKKYGAICIAYVALTRAKKALYVVTTELGKKTTSKNFARHLLLQFGDASAPYGDANWFEAHPLLPQVAAKTISCPAFQNPCQGTPKPVSPSSFKAERPRGAGFVNLTLDAAALGTEVHEALAKIAWLDAQEPHCEGLSSEAAALVRNFLAQPSVRAVFTRPTEPLTLWREQAFDILLEEQWVSGVFDRVVIRHSDEGNHISATIYDFKTDHSTQPELEERYAGQMQVYRQAACTLLGLQPDQVHSQILRVRS